MMDFEGAIAEIKNKDNAETFNKSVHSLQAIVDNLLAHGTYGLSALKTLLDAFSITVPLRFTCGRPVHRWRTGVSSSIFRDHVQSLTLLREKQSASLKARKK